jgi:hypothetical protein
MGMRTLLLAVSALLVATSSSADGASPDIPTYDIQAECNLATGQTTGPDLRGCVSLDERSLDYLKATWSFVLPTQKRECLDIFDPAKRAAAGLPGMKSKALEYHMLGLCITDNVSIPGLRGAAPRP